MIDRTDTIIRHSPSYVPFHPPPSPTSTPISTDCDEPYPHSHWLQCFQRKRCSVWSFCCCLSFYNCIVQLGFLPRESPIAFPGESKLRQSSATQTTVHARYFSVSRILRTLTGTTGSLTCAHILMPATAHRYHSRICTEVDSGRKIPCRTGTSNLRQRRAGPTLYQLSYILILKPSLLLKVQCNTK